MRYFSSGIVLFSHEAAVGLYLVLLYLFHTTGRKFLSSQCFGFVGVLFWFIEKQKTSTFTVTFRPPPQNRQIA